jgi:hypothetical protein
MKIFLILAVLIFCGFCIAWVFFNTGRLVGSLTEKLKNYKANRQG